MTFEKLLQLEGIENFTISHKMKTKNTFDYHPFVLLYGDKNKLESFVAANNLTTQYGVSWGDLYDDNSGITRIILTGES